MHLIKSVLIESNVSESRDSYSRFGRRKTAVLFPKLTDQNISAPTNDSWNPSNQQETLYKPDPETPLPSLGTSPDFLRHEGCISYVEEGSSHLSHVKRKHPHGRIASWVTSREIQAPFLMRKMYSVAPNEVSRCYRVEASQTNLAPP